MTSIDRQTEIEEVQDTRPHIVLLGAGASLAAFHDGERNGRKLPLMNNFVQTVPRIADILESVVTPQSWTQKGSHLLGAMA
jgi:hypothetical protein